MTRLVRPWLCAIALLIAAPLPHVFGQPAPPAPQDLASLRPADEIRLTTSDGRVTEGRFLSSSDAVVEWESAAGAARTPLADVLRIEARDPVGDGVKRGAIVGGIAGGTFGVLLGVGLSCTRDCGEDYSRAKDITGGLALGAAFGALQGMVYGLLLDATLHRHRLVYSTPSAPRVTVSPAIDPTRRALLVTAGW